MNFVNRPRNYSIKTSGDPVQLNDLMVRLMYRMHPMGPGGGELLISAVEVPEGVLDRVPLPEGSRIIGSSRNSDGSTIVVEAPIKTEQVREFYLDRMSKAGWTKPESYRGMGRGGFESQYLEQIMGLTFCGGENGPALTIGMHDRGNGTTDVFLAYQTNAENSPCSKKMQGRHRMMMMPDSVLPTLKAPLGEIQTGGGAGRNGSREHSQAQLRSHRTLEDVSNYYRAQLEKAGWTVTKEKVEESSAQSTYSFKDEDGNRYTGYLLVLARPEAQGMYSVFLEADESDKEDDRVGGSFWSS